MAIKELRGCPQASSGSGTTISPEFLEMMVTGALPPRPQSAATTRRADPTRKREVTDRRRS
jgi:hypothetical protein